MGSDDIFRFSDSALHREEWKAKLVEALKI